MKEPKKTFNITDHGKIPPQATDVEEAVLGACMLESAIDRVLDLLRPESFYKEAHQKIFSCLIELYKENSTIDLMTVAEKLLKKGQIEEVGGAYYIAGLTTKITTARNIESHAKIVAEKYMARELIAICSEAAGQAYDSEMDIFDALTKAESRLNEVSDIRNKVNIRPIRDVVDDNVRDLEDRIEKKKQGIDVNISTGFSQLDKATGGFHPGDLTIIAARPGMGKTAFALSLVKNISKQVGRTSAFFSLEVSSEQVANRLIAMESGINLSKIRDARLEDSDFENLAIGVKKLHDWNLFVDDTPALTILELKTKARRLKNLQKIEILFVDYLQLMRGDRELRGNREQEISSISRSLKALAKELKIPVVALSQLSRSVETRGGDKRPQLSDLRESGAIEQDADNVAFLYRPEYYKIMQDENGDSTEGLVEYLIRKQRHGETGDIFLSFTPETGRFYDRSFREEDPVSRYGFKDRASGEDFDSKPPF